MSKSVKILDVTLRDGMHAMGHQLTAQQMADLAGGIDSIGVDSIEFGHGNGLGGSSLQFGFAAASDLEYIKAVFSVVSRTKLAVIIIPGVGTRHELTMAAEHGVSIARLATQITECNIARQHIGMAKELGMQPRAVLPSASALTVDDTLRYAQMSESFGAEVVYLLDGGGYMLPQQVFERVAAMGKTLDVPIGFHGHNNLQLAVANSLAAVDAGAVRCRSSRHNRGDWQAGLHGRPRRSLHRDCLHAIAACRFDRIGRCNVTGPPQVQSRMSRWKKMEQVSQRVGRIRERMLAITPEIFADRARLVTESYLETMGRPYIIRRAHALERVLSEMEICVDEEQLIAGSFAGRPRGCQIFPEYDIQFVVDELDSFADRTADRFVLTEECKSELREIHHRWEGNSLADSAVALFPPEAAEPANDLIFLLTAIRSGVGHVIVDYGRPLAEGLLATMRRAQELRDALDPSDSEFGEKRAYYQAVLIVADAVIRFAGRFAELAESLAAATTESTRKRELQGIATACRKVPAHPAESFQEAIQSFWFIHLVLHLEANGHSISPGRFDQYIYRWFRRDIEDGKLDTEDADELLHCLWLKFFEINKVRDEVSSIAFGGYPMFQNLILGGQKRDGSSAVNKLSHLCLEASARLGLSQPSLSVRWYFGSNEQFTRHAMEVVSYGAGFPAMFNDEVLIPNMLQAGYTLEEAREYAIVGCTETTVPGISEPWLTGGFLNLLKLLELTVFNGYDPLLEKQYALATGEVESFQSFDEFMAAYDRQIAYYLRQLITCDNILDALHGEICPTPFESIYIDGCMDTGRTSLEGGARYNFTTLEAVGIANVAYSLAAIQRVIYDDASLSWGELKLAMRSDFLEHEELRLRLVNTVPKYGNDDDFVDLMGARVLDMLHREVQGYRSPRGGR